MTSSGTTLKSQSISNIAKRIGMNHNVSIRIIDEPTGRVVAEHTGHNASTNSLLTGIAHYLTGDGVLNQGEILSMWVPKYISLGTMGLMNQDSDDKGLPKGLGNMSYLGLKLRDLSEFDKIVLNKIDSKTGAYLPGFSGNDDVSEDEDEILRFTDYMNSSPGYGADGYDVNSNNNRNYLGLGPRYDNRDDISKTINCELITESIHRSPITFRDIVPEKQSEYPETIDVVFSAFISTGELSRYRDSNRDYVFITEAGLWSRPDWVDGGDNGLLAGYRIAPPDQSNWGMSPYSITDNESVEYLLSKGYKEDDITTEMIVNIKHQIAKEHRELLRKNIIRIGPNQVAQIIWKIQLGGIKQFGGLELLQPSVDERKLKWMIY